MTSLDSRNLGYTDTYARRFTEPGDVRYRVATATHGCAALDPDEATYVIEVRDSHGPHRKNGHGHEPRQHDVSVSQGDDGHLVAAPEHLTVDAGDIVLWHAEGSYVPAFAVQGESDAGAFDSTALGSETMFTHAFGSPGDYPWTDANGSGLRGVVRVRSLDSTDRGACEKWHRTLSEGVLVLIKDDSAEPAEVEILAGQTVAFAVTGGDRGITVTEEALLAGMPQHGPHA